MKVNNSALGLLVLALAWLTPRIEAQGPGTPSVTPTVTRTPPGGAGGQPILRPAPLGPGLCAGGTPAGCCGTATVSFSGSIGPIQPPSSSQVTVSKFDPALGQLLKVEYTVTITIPNTAQFPNRAQFENTNTSSTCTLINYSFQTNFLVNEPTGLTNPQPMFPGGQQFACSNAPNHLFQPFDGTLDGLGPSGLTETCAPVAPVTSQVRCRDSAADLAFFTATAPGQTAAFPFNTASSQTLNSTCNNFFAQISTFCRIDATVVYTYCNNRPPVANDDTFTICQGTGSSCLNVLQNDTDPENQLNCSSITIVTPPPASAGTVQVNAACTTGAPCANCCINFTPTPGFTGTTTFVYQVADQNPTCTDTGIVTVNVCNTTAVNDTGTICAGTTSTFDVLANDSTTCGALDCTTMQLVAPPAGFSLVGCGTANCTNCRIQYVAPPSPGSGTVSVTYRISNNSTPACQATGILTLTICNTTAGNDSGTVCTGGTATFNVLANDSTTCGTLDCTTMTLVAPVPTGFSLVNCGTANCANCRIQYVAGATPGTVTVAYRISNNSTPACPATGVLTVNVCSVTAGNDAGTVCAGSTGTFNVLANDSTTCGTLDCTTMQLVAPVPSGFALTGCGSASCTGCQIQYAAPASPGSGTVTVAYRISNNSTPICQAQGVLTVTVCSTTASNDTGTICAGTTGTFNVLANDSTTCGTLDCTTMALVAPVPPGISLLNCGTASCTNCRIQYVAPPSPGSGTVTVAYRISNNSSPACQATGVLTINVCSTTAGNDSGTICAGTTSTFDVLANDSTTCGTLDCTTMALVAPVPPGITLVNCGTASCTNCRIQYAAPASPGTGTVTVAYRISNNSTPACQAQGVLTISVCSVTAANDAGTICAGTTGTFNVAANDSTTCGTLDCSTMTLVAPVPPGFSLVNCGTASCANCRIQYVAPASPGSGTVTVAYRISNNSNPVCTGQGVLTVTLCSTTAGNDTGAICAGSTGAFNVLANDSTTCGTLDCTTMALVAPVPPGISLVNCGTASCTNCRIQYVAPPSPGSGTVTVAYRISNNSTPACQAQGVLTINVCSTTAGNDSGTICAGTTRSFDVLANDSTTCGTLDCTTMALVAPVPPGITLVNCSTANCANCRIQYVAPASPGSGTVTVAYRISNNSTPACQAQGVLTIAVCSVTAVNDNGGSVCFGTVATFDVLANDSTSCGTLDCSTMQLNAPVPPGFTLTGCGTANCSGCRIRYDSSQAAGNGPVSVTYQISNNSTPACTATAVLTVSVCRVNALPESITMCQGESRDVFVLENDQLLGGTNCGLLDCSSLTITTPPDPSCGTAVRAGTCPSGGTACPNCFIRFTPAPTFAGTCTFAYSVSSTAGTPCTGTAIVTVTVNPRVDAQDDVFLLNGQSGPPFVIHVTANDSAGPGCTLICPVTITVPPAFGTVTTNGCDVLYTPGVNFVDTDSFRYSIDNTCHCPDDALVTIRLNPDCIPRNRQDCGSLLLFTEFDNRNGVKTLYTITDACCENPGPQGRIELRFISKDTCLETNRTYVLTACDTLTFLTNVVGPAGQQGYMYAYAKSSTGDTANPIGTPIVFNRLIGQQMMINGISTFDYALNAVSFRGLGAADGELNDDDHDGIRDLNGPDSALPEYDEAPDRIYIPRFLGQDPPGGAFDSEIVLINLSGGRAFTTIVSLLVANDNEEFFSGEHQFYCWERLPLRELSSFTLESALDTTAHDRDEIRGASTRESGWLQLDGLLAQSSAEVIDDPAIYAVLIERVNGRFAADLPFEYCSQKNGDLLPTSLFGDGPVPVDDDDQ